jgi:hypothetical protein
VLIIIGKARFEKAIAELHKEAIEKVEGELKGIRSISDLTSKVKTLRGEVETLSIEKGRKEEEFARKEREIEHKVGLERKRQEQEIALSKRESTVSVREENLKADRDRFEGQMKFQEERFTKEVGYLKEMLGDIVQRLPSAEFTADLSPRRKRA